MEPRPLLELRVRELLDAVPARAPAPGGGAVAAIAAALAAGLTTMAARFAPEEWERRAEIIGRAEELRARIEPLADRDAAAYGAFLSERTAGDPRADRGDSVRARRALGRACPPGGTRRCRRQSERSRRRRRGSRARGCGSEHRCPPCRDQRESGRSPDRDVHANWPTRPGTQPLRRATPTSSLVRTRPRDCPWVTARRDMPRSDTS